jgi:hypothetical protein
LEGAFGALNCGKVYLITRVFNFYLMEDHFMGGILMVGKIITFCAAVALALACSGNALFKSKDEPKSSLRSADAKDKVDTEATVDAVGVGKIQNQVYGAQTGSNDDTDLAVSTDPNPEEDADFTNGTESASDGITTGSNGDDLLPDDGDGGCVLLHASLAPGGELKLHWYAPDLVSQYQTGETLDCSYAGATGCLDNGEVECPGPAPVGDIIPFSDPEDALANLSTGHIKCEFDDPLRQIVFDPPFSTQPVTIRLGNRTCTYSVGFNADGTNTDPNIGEWPPDDLFGWEG